MVEQTKPKLMYVSMGQHMYDLIIQKLGPNGGFDPNKIKLTVIPLIKTNG